MPRRRQAKVLAAIQEDEILEGEEQQQRSVHPLNAELTQLLEEFEQQVQERAQALLDQANAECRALMNDFAVQLVKLPKQVRDMPLGQFKTKYGEDIGAVMLEEINKRIAASQAAPRTVLRAGSSVAEPATVAVARTTRKRRDPAEGASQSEAAPADTAVKRTRKTAGVLAAVQQDNMQLAETPAVAAASARGIPFTPAVPATAMRVPVLGETFYSQKGSPLGVFEQDPKTKQVVLNTAMKGGLPLTTPMPGAALAAGGQAAVATVFNRKRGSKTGVADSMVVTTSDGEVVTVDLEGGLASVPAQYRKEVAAQLEALRKLATVALNNVTRRRG